MLTGRLAIAISLRVATTLLLFMPRTCPTVLLNKVHDAVIAGTAVAVSPIPSACDNLSCH